MRILIVMAVAIAAGMAAALAQGAAPLGEAALRRALLGVELSGVHEPSGQPWRECIEPDGHTRFYFGDAPMRRGRLTITAAGQACFSYADRDFLDTSCWIARPEGAALRFTPADGAGGSFLATDARRGVRSCRPAPPAVS